jgi:hypothetical protein
VIRLLKSGDEPTHVPDEVIAAIRQFRCPRNGSSGHCAQRQILKADVCDGSKADIGLPPIDVRFTPKSGHC